MLTAGTRGAVAVGALVVPLALSSFAAVGLAVGILLLLAAADDAVLPVLPFSLATAPAAVAGADAIGDGCTVPVVVVAVERCTPLAAEVEVASALAERLASADSCGRGGGNEGERSV